MSLETPRTPLDCAKLADRTDRFLPPTLKDDLYIQYSLRSFYHSHTMPNTSTRTGPLGSLCNELLLDIFDWLDWGKQPHDDRAELRRLKPLKELSRVNKHFHNLLTRRLYKTFFSAVLVASPTINRKVINHLEQCPHIVNSIQSLCLHIDTQGTKTKHGGEQLQPLLRAISNLPNLKTLDIELRDDNDSTRFHTLFKESAMDLQKPPKARTCLYRRLCRFVHLYNSSTSFCANDLNPRRQFTSGPNTFKLAQLQTLHIPCEALYLLPMCPNVSDLRIRCTKKTRPHIHKLSPSSKVTKLWWLVPHAFVEQSFLEMSHAYPAVKHLTLQDCSFHEHAYDPYKIIRKFGCVMMETFPEMTTVTVWTRSLLDFSRLHAEVERRQDGSRMVHWKRQTKFYAYRPPDFTYPYCDEVLIELGVIRARLWWIDQ